MVNVTVIYSWSIWGASKGEPYWAVSKCKIRHGKTRRTLQSLDV